MGWGRSVLHTSRPAYLSPDLRLDQIKVDVLYHCRLNPCLHTRGGKSTVTLSTMKRIERKYEYLTSANNDVSRKYHIFESQGCHPDYDNRDNQCEPCYLWLLSPGRIKVYQEPMFLPLPLGPKMPILFEETNSHRTAMTFCLVITTQPSGTCRIQNRSDHTHREVTRSAVLTLWLGQGRPSA